MHFVTWLIRQVTNRLVFAYYSPLSWDTHHKRFHYLVPGWLNGKEG